MKKSEITESRITEYDVNMFFLKIFFLSIAVMWVIVIWNYYIKKHNIELSKNNIYSYCAWIYENFETSWAFIEFVDHCMLKNK
jgi:hypothetical protein